MKSDYQDENKVYECDIIIDLLPLYIEQEVSKVTKDVIDQHLAKCEKCCRIYEMMNSDIDLKIKSEKTTCRSRMKRRPVGKMIIVGYLLLLFLFVILIFNSKI